MLSLQRCLVSSALSEVTSYGRHPRLGASSIVQRISLDAAAEILKWLGPSTVHARVIMAIDGDNNQSCGRPECEACTTSKPSECWLDGQPGLARAIRGLLSASGALTHLYHRCYAFHTCHTCSPTSMYTLNLVRTPVQSVTHSLVLVYMMSQVASK